MSDDAHIARAILDAVEARGAGKTICPSEVARILSDDWRPLMRDIRRVAQSLADGGALSITQKGQSAHALRTKGPIRLGLPSTCQ